MFNTATQYIEFINAYQHHTSARCNGDDFKYEGRNFHELCKENGITLAQGEAYGWDLFQKGQEWYEAKLGDAICLDGYEPAWRKKMKAEEEKLNGHIITLADFSGGRA